MGGHGEDKQPGGAVSTQDGLRGCRQGWEEWDWAERSRTSLTAASGGKNEAPQ